jgi:hypothetical protein
MNMTTKNKWPSALLAVAITLVAGAIRAQDQQRQQRTPEGAVSVNDLAGKSGEYLGQVQLIGVVAAVSQGQGFVLVDKREYADCGLTCVAEPGTKKIPVRWSGDAPNPFEVQTAGHRSAHEALQRRAGHALRPPAQAGNSLMRLIHPEMAAKGVRRS